MIRRLSFWQWAFIIFVLLIVLFTLLANQTLQPKHHHTSTSDPIVLAG